MPEIIIDSKDFKKLISKIDRIEQFIKESKKAPAKWISEEDAMILTKLGKSSLRKKRSRGIFTYSTATGRKIKYLKKEIEDYLNDNSTK